MWIAHSTDGGGGGGGRVVVFYDTSTCKRDVYFPSIPKMRHWNLCKITQTQIGWLTKIVENFRVKHMMTFKTNIYWTYYKISCTNCIKGGTESYRTGSRHKCIKNAISYCLKVKNLQISWVMNGIKYAHKHWSLRVYKILKWKVDSDNWCELLRLYCSFFAFGLKKKKQRKKEEKNTANNWQSVEVIWIHINSLQLSSLQVDRADFYSTFWEVINDPSMHDIIELRWYN